MKKHTINIGLLFLSLNCFGAQQPLKQGTSVLRAISNAKQKTIQAAQTAILKTTQKASGPIKAAQPIKGSWTMPTSLQSAPVAPSQALKAGIVPSSATFTTKPLSAEQIQTFKALSAQNQPTGPSLIPFAPENFEGLMLRTEDKSAPTQKPEMITTTPTQAEPLFEDQGAFFVPTDEEEKEEIITPVTIHITEEEEPFVFPFADEDVTLFKEAQTWNTDATVVKPTTALFEEASYNRADTEPTATQDKQTEQAAQPELLSDTALMVIDNAPTLDALPIQKTAPSVEELAQAESTFAAEFAKFVNLVEAFITGEKTQPSTPSTSPEQPSALIIQPEKTSELMIQPEQSSALMMQPEQPSALALQSEQTTALIPFVEQPASLTVPQKQETSLTVIEQPTTPDKAPTASDAVSQDNFQNFVKASAGVGAGALSYAAMAAKKPAQTKQITTRIGQTVTRKAPVIAQQTTKVIPVPRAQHAPKPVPTLQPTAPTKNFVAQPKKESKKRINELMKLVEQPKTVKTPKVKVDTKATRLAAQQEATRSALQEAEALRLKEVADAKAKADAEKIKLERIKLKQLEAQAKNDAEQARLAADQEATRIALQEAEALCLKEVADAKAKADAEKIKLEHLEIERLEAEAKAVRLAAEEAEITRLQKQAAEEIERLDAQLKADVEALRLAAEEAEATRLQKQPADEVAKLDAQLKTDVEAKVKAKRKVLKEPKTKKPTLARSKKTPTVRPITRTKPTLHTPQTVATKATPKKTFKPKTVVPKQATMAKPFSTVPHVIAKISTPPAVKPKIKMKNYLPKPPKKQPKPAAAAPAKEEPKVEEPKKDIETETKPVETKAADTPASEEMNRQRRTPEDEKNFEEGEELTKQVRTAPKKPKAAEPAPQEEPMITPSASLAPQPAQPKTVATHGMVLGKALPAWASSIKVEPTKATELSIPTTEELNAQAARKRVVEDYRNDKALVVPTKHHYIPPTAAAPSVSTSALHDQAMPFVNVQPAPTESAAIASEVTNHYPEFPNLATPKESSAKTFFDFGKEIVKATIVQPLKHLAQYVVDTISSWLK